MSNSNEQLPDLDLDGLLEGIEKPKNSAPAPKADFDIDLDLGGDSPEPEPDVSLQGLTRELAKEVEAADGTIQFPPPPHDVATANEPVLPAVLYQEPVENPAPPVAASQSTDAFDLDNLLSDIEVPTPATKPADTAPEESAPLRESAASPLLPVGGGGVNTVYPPVEDPSAPSLPLDAREPPAQPQVGLEGLQPDPATLAALQRLAGPGGDPERARAALVAALRGENYNVRHLPDARTIALGIARVLTQNGIDPNHLIDVIIQGLDE